MKQDQTCERAVIGSILSFSDTIATIRGFLTPECFTSAIYRQIYQSALEVNDDGSIPDLITVSAALSKKGSKVEVTDLIDATQSACVGDVTPYALRLRELSNRRNLLNVGQHLIDAANSELEPIDEVLTKSRSIIDKASEYSTNKVVTLSDAVVELKEKIKQNLSGETAHCTKTGFAQMDTNGGLHPGDLIVVAADTSTGKSSFALTISLNAITQGHKVAFYSLEMMNHQLAARMLSMVSKVTSAQYLYGKPDSRELERLDAAARMLPLDNLILDDKATSNIETILASIRSLYAKEHISGAIVDYIQILNVNTSSRLNKEQLMAEVARRLKNLAKELGIWIMVLSQLNRDSENPEPQNSRIRDSGQIAEAADTVLMLYRPELYGKNYPKPFDRKSTHNTAMVKCTKGRNTGIFTFICTFVPELTMFVDEDAKVISVDDNMPF